MTWWLVPLWVGWVLLGGIWLRNRMRVRTFVTAIPPARLVAVFRSTLSGSGWKVASPPNADVVPVVVTASRRGRSGSTVSAYLSVDVVGRRSQVSLGPGEVSFLTGLWFCLRDPLAAVAAEIEELDPLVVMERSFVDAGPLA